MLWFRLYIYLSVFTVFLCYYNVILEGRIAVRPLVNQACDFYAITF